MQIWKADDRCREIGVLLFDQFSNHCLANAIEPLRAANTLARKSLYRWRFLSIDGAPVTSSSGLPVTPETELRKAEGGDYLLVMPSYHFRDHARTRNLQAIRAATSRYRALIGMDTGAWLLAAAGLLNGRRATLHWDELPAFAETFPEVQAVAARFVVDGDRLSCGGVTTSLDLILHLIGEHHGPMLALEVAAFFMQGAHDPRPEMRPGTDQRLRRAVSLMRMNIETPLPIPELAQQLGMDRKRLETVFRRSLGQPPLAIYKALRLREARRLAEHSHHSIAEIAMRCGYDDPAAMTRAFRAEFGMTPSACRRQA